MRPRPWHVLLIAAALLPPTLSASAHAFAARQASPVATSQERPSMLPDSQECASCHAQIFNSYKTTAMATASGLAKDGLVTGEFVHKPSGVHYRVYEQEGYVWMSYEREGKEKLSGKKELSYFIGSGKKGRTYLFSDQGFWFEAPINWYSQEKRWNMTPAYTEATQIPMNLPAYADCLNCHTSGMQPPIPGTDSKFAGKPFLHAGITCERCHGSGSEHASGKGPIVNPAKLPSERRDSICMECHFEGTVAIQQPERHAYEFKPGDNLSDYVHYFILATSQERAPQALSQFEALSLSVCKRKSGDKMWCGSCHDAHSEPAPAEKAAFYRGKCLACHGEAFGAKHHPEKPDCAHCHMPALPSRDVAHTEATDHRILRFADATPQPQLLIRGKPLLSFPASDEPLATTRDFALAWETLAQTGVDGASRQADVYLQKAVKDRPDDPVLLSALGYLEQAQKHDGEARDLYTRALKADPLLNDTETDLGILEARAGDLPGAVKLWESAFARAPNRSAIGMNLAMAFCIAGQKDVARKFVDRVLEFNPDFSKAKSLLVNLGKDPVQCKP